MVERVAARGARVPPAIVTAPLALPRAVTRLRRDPPDERITLLALSALAVATWAASEVLGPEIVPVSFQMLPLLGGGLLLGRRSMRRLAVVVALCVVASLVTLGVAVVRPGNLVVIAVTAAVLYEFARSREETGLAGSSGEGVLVELRQRLEQQGALPALPPPWRVEAVVRPAGGGPFAGDFVVSGITGGGQSFELALVDVSGKGVAAATRALLLSGALGGLLGAVPPEEFLPGANSYLIRQEWEEGFATAVHLVLDLEYGDFVVESAGHPPAAHFDAGSGRWRLLGSEGLALGLLPAADFVPDRGRLARGDALLLYTDGLVEVSGRDLSLGIDKLLGEAERLVPRGFDGGGEILVRQVANRTGDDRGLVLIWRAD